MPKRTIKYTIYFSEDKIVITLPANYLPKDNNFYRQSFSAAVEHFIKIFPSSMIEAMGDFGKRIKK